MKKFFLFLIFSFIGIGLYVWIGKVIGLGEMKKFLQAFNVYQAAIIFGLTFLIALIGIWRWREILKESGVRISFIALLKPYFGGFAIVFLVPMVLLGGEILRAYILKKKNGVSWIKGLASIITDRILEWTVNFIIIFLGACYFLFKIGLPPKSLGIIFGLFFLLLAIAIFFFYSRVFKKESVVRFFLDTNNKKVLAAEEDVFKFFKFRKKAVWKGLGLSFLRAGAMALRVWVLIYFLEGSIGYLIAFSILGFSYLAALIPIPTALGSHEVIQIFAFNSFGLRTGAAAAFTMIIRGAELLLALGGLAILFQLGIKVFKGTFSREPSFNDSKGS